MLWFLFGVYTYSMGSIINLIQPHKDLSQTLLSKNIVEKFVGEISNSDKWITLDQSQQITQTKFNIHSISQKFYYQKKIFYLSWKSLLKV